MHHVHSAPHGHRPTTRPVTRSITLAEPSTPTPTHSRTCNACPHHPQASAGAAAAAEPAHLSEAACGWCTRLRCAQLERTCACRMELRVCVHQRTRQLPDAGRAAAGHGSPAARSGGPTRAPQTLSVTTEVGESRVRAIASSKRRNSECSRSMRSTRMGTGSLSPCPPTMPP